MKGFVQLFGLGCLMAAIVGPQLCAGMYENICRLHQDGTKLRDPYACDTYITCVDSTEVRTKCAAGKVYSLDKGCIASETGCDNPCAPDYDAVWAKDPKSCKGYYYCRNGTALFGLCPDDLHFDEDLQRCVYSWESTCETDEYCHITPNGVKFKKPGSCTEYYTCTKGVLTTSKCKTGKAFDREVASCEDENTIEGCQFYCRGVKNTLVSDYKSCRGYYFCADKGTASDVNPEWRQCPERTFFDKATQSCGDPADIKCSYDRCDGRPDIFVNSATNCMHYLTCRDGVTVSERMCSGYTFFDEKRQICTAEVITYNACA